MTTWTDALCATRSLLSGDRNREYGLEDCVMSYTPKVYMESFYALRK